MKKIVILFCLISFSFVQGMEHFDLRLKINDIADQHRWDFPPRWAEDQATQIVRESMNRQINRELSELAFPYQSFFEEDHTKQEHADLGGQLEPLSMQHNPNYDQHDYEVDRRLEPLQSQSTYHVNTRSSVPNPDRVQGWIYKDDWIFPFVSTPDMSNDPEINRFKTYLENHDAASLHHEIIAQQANLQNRSFIDRVNRYKISRRLSFIIKHVRGNPAMYYLLQIHQAKQLEDAYFGLEQLRTFLNNQASIEVNGKQIKLNDHKISEITQVARRLIEQSTYYQAEKQKYPEAKVGGQLLNQSPILTKIDMALRKSNSPYKSVTSQKSSVDPLIDTLTRKINNTSIEDQIAAITDLQIKISTDPVTDFPTYVQEIEQVISSLKNSGKWTVETAELITKGFVEGAAEHIVHTVKHPIESAQNFVKANRDLLKLIADIMPPMSDEFSMEPEHLKWYESELNRKAELIAQAYNHLCETVPQTSREQWGRIAGQLFADWGMLKGAGKGLKLAKNIPAMLEENPLYARVQQSLEQALLKNPEMVTTEGVTIQGIHATEQSLLQTMSNDAQKTTKNIAKNITNESEKLADVINQTSEAILKNGYYEVNGFKFSEIYYNRLWNEGRKAPSLIAKEILEHATMSTIDKELAGFYRYEYGGWELVYNPTTKEVWHLQPMKKK